MIFHNWFQNHKNGITNAYWVYFLLLSCCSHKTPRFVGHRRHVMMKKPPNYVGNLALQLSVPGQRPRDRPKTRWKSVVLRDMTECSVSIYIRAK